MISRVVDWLTAGYPEGIPPTDRIAVVALLKRRLTDDQVRHIVSEVTLESDGSVITEDEVTELIHRVLDEPPSDDDIHRVSARLAAGGWPLEESLEAAARLSDEESGGQNRAGSL